MGFFDGMNRRDFLRMAGTASGAAMLGSTLEAMAGPLIEKAYAVDPCGTGSLNDIEHFVLLMMENRSFDHYFGTMSGVRGFNDPNAIPNVFKQYGYNTFTRQADPNGYLMPFRLDTTLGASLDGECINDPTHNWGPQHVAWNGGRMDQWVKVHVASEGVANGPATMGYYTRQDIPVHWALADAFTICDSYFCSVMGPTDPNRLYWISGTIDPDGTHGGPLLETPTLIPTNQYSWRTYPENLQEAGVSWKVYTSQQAPVASGALLSGMMQSFKQTFDPTKPYLATNGVAPTYELDFKLDVATGNLPAVSWVIPPLLNCEHPALPPSYGAITLMEVLNTLVSNPAVWEKTALIISYDENGGFFDHVAPPTAPVGTPGEYLTVNPLSNVKSSDGIAGPIGLGFRVPAMVISPFSRGGLVASEVFDHTSQLRLLEKRFGVPVPNLSAWRRATVGDMTSTFNFAAAPDASRPQLKATTELDPASTLIECKLGIDGLSGSFGNTMLTPYPVPFNSTPIVETSPHRGRPSGPVEPCDPPPPAAPGANGPLVAPILPRVAVGGGPQSRIATASEQIAASSREHVPGAVDAGKEGAKVAIPDEVATALGLAATAAVACVATGEIRKRTSGS